MLYSTDGATCAPHPDWNREPGGELCNECSELLNGISHAGFMLYMNPAHFTSQLQIVSAGTRPDDSFVFSFNSG